MQLTQSHIPDHSPAEVEGALMLRHVLLNCHRRDAHLQYDFLWKQTPVSCQHRHPSLGPYHTYSRPSCHLGQGPGPESAIEVRRKGAGEPEPLNTMQGQMCTGYRPTIHPQRSLWSERESVVKTHQAGKTYQWVKLLDGKTWPLEFNLLAPTGEGENRLKWSSDSIHALWCMYEDTEIHRHTQRIFKIFERITTLHTFTYFYSGINCLPWLHGFKYLEKCIERQFGALLPIEVEGHCTFVCSLVLR